MYNSTCIFSGHYLAGCWRHRLCLGQKKQEAAAKETKRTPKATPTAMYSTNDESSIGTALERTSCSAFLRSSRIGIVLIE